MRINIIPFLVSFILIPLFSVGKNYCKTSILIEDSVEVLYDFEYQGLYYEFAENENEVNLVRDSTLRVPMYLECIYEKILEMAYNDGNTCYTGDIIVPDSVEFQGKKYRVAAVNQHAFSFSKDLRSVVFNSNVEFPIDDHDYYAFGHFFMCKELRKVVYHDSLTAMFMQLGRCYNLKEIHYPSKLTSIESSINYTPISEFDLSNQAGYRPSRFYINNCFLLPNLPNEPSPESQKVTYPECDTLHIRYSYSYSYGKAPGLEQQSVVIRPCKHIILDFCDFPFYRIEGIKSIKIISQAETPPEIHLINQIDRETVYRDKAVLYVPDEAMEAYGDAFYWQDFGEIRPMSEYLREEAAEIDVPIMSEATAPQISLRSDREELHITATSPVEVTVWSLQGLPLWSGKIVDEATVTLPKGVYIVTTPTSSRKYRH